MAELIEFYTNSVNKKTGYFAAWPINSTIKLGDYGKLNGKLFVKHGNIIDMFHINVIEQPGIGTVKEYSFKEGKNVSMIANAGVSDGNISSSIEIKFEGECGVFFSIDGCSYSEVRNFQEVGERVIEQYISSNWDEDFVLVTDLVKADASTIVISNGDNAEIKLGFDTQGTSVIDSINSNSNISIMNQANIGLHLIAKDNLIPLIGLSNLKVSFIGKPEWGKYDIKKKSVAKKFTSFMKRVSNPKNRNPRALGVPVEKGMVASISLIESNNIVTNRFLSEEFIQRELKHAKYRKQTRNRNIMLRDGSIMKTTKYNVGQIRSAILMNKYSVNTNTTSYKKPNSKAKLVTFQKIKY